jgi:DNA topoisomerase-1
MRMQSNKPGTDGDPRAAAPDDPEASARRAGLRYVSDHAPGIRRVRSGRGFRYVDPQGRTIDDRETFARIKALAIPPAWEEVWICPRPDGHIQATGRDDKGRKQYRYHQRWREVRDESKYDRMIAFARALPKIRRRVARDLARPGMPREKVLAAVVRLLETTMIRVGNAEYARKNRSYGLTTLHGRHARVAGSVIRFRFRGKHGKVHDIDLEDRHLAGIVRRCQELPGQELFGYVDDDGEVRDVASEDVNDYLRATSGESFTAKDFRTWAGTVLASLALQEFEAVGTKAEARRNIVRAIESVSERLGNTPAVCRKCYVHPAVLDAYLDGTMIESLKRRADQAMARSLPRLRAEEAAVLALLQRRLADESRRSRPRRPRKPRALTAARA